MSAGHEIDYEALIDRSIKDFRPARRLLPVGARLAYWTAFEAAILALAVAFQGYGVFRESIQYPEHFAALGLLLLASITAAFLSLSSAIPGRELTLPQIFVVTALVGLAFAFQPGVRPHESLETIAVGIGQVFGLVALPWLCLFWAVRRGVPLQPEVTGAAAGLAAFCLAGALWQIVYGLMPGATVILTVSCAITIILSILAGQFWLNWIRRSLQEAVAPEISSLGWAAFPPRAGFSLAFAGAVGALVLVLQNPSVLLPRVPDFDLAIESYQRALNGFHPNVPSTSIDAMLSAYVEHGMPAYMWDFSPEGLKLVGGRWELLPDGTPITFTWFRGSEGAVMCIFKQTDAFKPPPIPHDEHHQLLFYRYRHFSFCLINVGGYGNFVSVITAAMALKQFEQLVLSATQ